MDLVQTLENALREDEDEGEWDNSLMHASDSAVILPQEEGGKCERNLWYRFKGARRKEPTIGELLRFDNAHRLHERIAELLEENEVEWEVLGVEMSISEYLPEDFTGRIDLLIRNVFTQEIVVLDIKTTKGRAIQMHRANPDSSLMPYNSNVTQIQIYIEGIKKKYPDYDIMRGQLFYIDREGSNRPVLIDVDPNPNILEESHELLRSIRESAAERSEPDHDVLEPEITININQNDDSFKIGLPFQCDYCKYRDVTCNAAIPDRMRIDELKRRQPENEPGRIFGHIDEDGGVEWKDFVPDYYRRFEQRVIERWLIELEEAEEDNDSEDDE